jgi:hypothetical protein
VTLYKGVCSLNLNGDHAEFSQYFRNTTLLRPFELNTWSGAINTLFGFVAAAGTSYFAMMSHLDSIDDLWVYTVDESSDRYTAVDRAYGPVGSGTNVNPPMTPESSVMALIYPAVRSRLIGRMYLPRICTDNAPDGALSPIAAFHVREMVDAYTTYLTTNLCTPVIRSRTRHLDQPAASHKVSTRFATTRTRRKSGTPTYQ